MTKIHSRRNVASMLVPLRLAVLLAHDAEAVGLMIDMY